MTTDPRVHVVRDVVPETPGVVTIHVVPVDGPPARFVPAQIGMLGAFGIGEAAMSISSSSSVLDHHEYTVRRAGAITTALHRLRPGDQLAIRGPFGRGWDLDASPGDVVVGAGGIGLAPLRSAIYQLLAQRDGYGRLVFLYGTRTPRDILYRRELERWRSRFDLDVEITVDHPGEDWYGRVGVVTTLIPFTNFDPFDTTALICGPEVMMRFTVAALRNRGVSSDDIYLSMERNMKCGIGLCGHCQFGREFVCKDGPVFPFSRIESVFKIREL